MPRSVVARLTLGARIAIATLPLAALHSADLPPQRLPVLGGSGGTAFARDCGPGRVLTGLRYRAGLVVDAIGIMCSPVLANGTLGPESIVGTLAGGSGGTTNVASCYGRALFAFKVYYGSYVSYLVPTCSEWKASTRTFSKNVHDFMDFPLGNNLTPSSVQRVEECSDSTQPGSGIQGRVGAFVDAIGLVCDEP